MPFNSRKIIFQNILLYSIAHAFVDFTCISLVVHANYLNLLPAEKFAFLILLYNFLAFAIQSPLGWLADKFMKPVHFAAAGIFLVILSVFFTNEPWITVILAGLGNSLFHLGGGVICLSLKPGKAVYPGIYVAPGALGVLMGTIVGKSYFPGLWIFVLPLVVIGLFIVFIKSPKLVYQQSPARKTNYFELILIMLLFTVVIRGLFGFVDFFTWKSGLLMAVFATVSVFSGKLTGGYLADRFGWMKISIFSLTMAAGIFTFFPGNWYIALVGIFLFNFTMPVTLTAVSEILHGNPGFSFGLTTMALFLGMLPTFVVKIENKALIMGLVIASAISLYTGLKLYLNDSRNKNEQCTESGLQVD